MLEHGGRLRAAAAHYGIPLADWLDLSTGINPSPWPLPPLPASVWQRLPEEEDGLEAAAAACYGNANLLPVAGSQAAIQLLPTLLPRAVIACLSPLYAEHPQAWQNAGHRLRMLDGKLSRALAAATPYVLLCNPNNPTASRHSRDALIDAARRLNQRGGWLIVDEAFIDPTPEDSVADLAGTADAPRLDRPPLAGKILRPGRGPGRLRPGGSRSAAPAARTHRPVDDIGPGQSRRAHGAGRS
jgi:cobalamin biosynthetic protein CobC